MSFFLNFFRLIFDLKKLILAIFFIILMNFIKNIINKKRKKDDDFIIFETMTHEEKKIFLITKFNTTINRNDPIEREKFIKKCKYIF